MSRRITDSRGEKALAVFLDNYFYEIAKEKERINSFERIYSKELQIKGIDIILNGNLKVDEKAQLYYMNSPVDSFAFEIDYYDEKKDKLIDGWFVNKSNETDAFLLIWIPKSRTNNINRLVADDFEDVDVNLIRKDSITSFLIRSGIDELRLKRKAQEMRNNNIFSFKLDNNCHMVFSKKGFTEEPINLVIKKNVLDELSDIRFKISKSDLIEI